jgi:uncharacterized membrane protein YfcA
VTLPIAGFILAMALVTSLVSGVFGMAGGLMLMGALALVLPVRAALVTHGLIQMVANGWRTVLHRKHVQWRIVGLYALGSAGVATALAFISYTPSKPLLYLLLGLVPGLTWLPRRILQLDAAKPPQAVLCGVLVTGLNLLAGVAGPLLDIFFIRTDMTRHRIVATKATTQVFSHLAKVIVYGAPLVGNGGKGMPPAWVFIACVPLAMTGTVLGGRVLDRLSDKRFLAWTRYIVTAIGVVYLLQAAGLQLGAE